MNASGKWFVRILLIVIIGGTIVWDLLQQSGNGRPFSWTGILIAGGMSIVLLPLIWRVTGHRDRENKLFADAQLGLATLVSASRTGSSVNDDPVIELVVDVQTSEGRTFRSKIRTFLEISEIPAMVPGATFPVEYLPDGRTRLHRSNDTSRVEDMLYDMRVRQGKMTPQQVRVAKEGVPAHAVVMSAEPTGEIRGGEAVIRLHVRVTRPDGTLFDNTRELPLPSQALPGLQPGSVVEARYLPGDESYVSVATRVN